MADQNAPTVSLVIPVYNEREVLPQLFDRLDALTGLCMDRANFPPEQRDSDIPND